MSMWKKAMDYLGLGPDDAYDDYPPEPELERPVRSARPVRDDGGRTSRGYDGGYEGEAPVRQVAARPSYPLREPDVTVRRSMPGHDDSNVQTRPMNQRPAAVVRPVVGAEPYTVRPRRFDSAQEIADKFRDGQPVIMNLEATDRETSRRLIDFASGLCYGLSGTMEKVASGVYLLKPPVRHAGHDTTGYGA